MIKMNRLHKNKALIILCVLLSAICLIVVTGKDNVYAEEAENGKLKNGSFEDYNADAWGNQVNYSQMNHNNVPYWNTTAYDGNKIELFKQNTQYISNVTLKPSDGLIAAELNADEESTLYQNVSTVPSSIYEWGLDHGARNYTDTMALVIGPKQDIDPSKPSKNDRDQLMQMVDWLIIQGETSIKNTAGLGEHLIVYSKKFAENGGFQDNTAKNAFSLTPSSIYTEEWHIWIIADSKSTSGENVWGHYGLNDSSATEKYYRYIVPDGQTETLFGFVSVGCYDSATEVSSKKTFGNFLDNIQFKIFHPLSGSTTNHGSGVIGGSDGTAEGEGSSSTGYTVTVNQNLVTYAVDGEPLKVQAVVAAAEADCCEFVGLYYTRQNANGVPVTVFLQRDGNEIVDTGSLTEAEKNGKWIKSLSAENNIVYTYYLDNITTAIDLQFVFIKSPTVTYDPNGGTEYIVDRTYNTTEEPNVYSYKPYEVDGNYTFISPYVSHAAIGQNDGWKFMGWLLTGDTGTSSSESFNSDQLGTLVLPAEHTIACDYSVGDASVNEQFFKIYSGNISLNNNSENTSSASWNTTETPVYANAHKGLTMVAQWRWRQAFLPLLKSDGGYVNSSAGGTVRVTNVTGISDLATDPNYNASFNFNGGVSYHAATNEKISVTAEANSGFVFEGWYDQSGNLITLNSTYTYVETRESVNTYYARFSGSVTQTFVRQVEEGGAWVDTTDSTIATLDRYSYSDIVGRSISSTAIAGSGYKFVGWFDSLGNEVSADKLSDDGLTISYTTNGDATYYARFSEKVTQTYIRQIENGNLWEDTTDDSIATLDCYSYSDIAGEPISSTATAGSGYEFVGWFDSFGNRVADSMLSNSGRTIGYTTTGDAVYYARFKEQVPVENETVTESSTNETVTDSGNINGNGSNNGSNNGETETEVSRNEETRGAETENEETRFADPQTGDESNPVFCIILILISAFTLAGLILSRRFFS